MTKIGKVKVSHVKKGGEDCGIEVLCEVVMRYGKQIPEIIREMQEKIKESIEYMTGMVVQKVNIVVTDLSVTA